ncbi:MAG: guanylate kinase [Lactobacillales bacterium]|nr:guanylate kinase [Lactobacillales bacterium]
MLKLNKKGSLIVISGPSGAGKDTVVNKLKEINDNIWVSISCTSRLPRGSEIDGKDYFFLTKEQFEEKINNNEFLEYAVYNDNYYGTPLYKINEKLNEGIDVILVIEVQGALYVKQHVKDAIFIFIMPPSMEELKNRLVNRKTESKDKILNRFKTAYNEINEITKYNYVVVNDEIEKASNKVNSIIMSEKCRVDRIEDVYVSNKEEMIHELLMDKKFDNE